GRRPSRDQRATHAARSLADARDDKGGMMNANSPQAAAALQALEARRTALNDDALRVADAMIAGVRAGGDKYVAEQIARFDGVTLAPHEIRIAPRAVTIGADIAAAIDVAIERVEAFHRPQLPQSYRRNGLEHRV